MYYAVRHDWLAKLDRTGKLVYKLHLAQSVSGRAGADAAGNAYVVAHVDRKRSLLRISPDGKRIDTLAVDHIQGGVLYHDNDLLLVGPDGTSYHVRYSMAVRVLAPDGRLVFISERARTEDADEAKRRAQADQ